MIVLVLPLAMTAQKGTPAQKTMKGEMEMDFPQYYGEVIITQQQNRDVVRVMFDNATQRLIQGKAMKEEINLLSQIRFQSPLHALNTLSGLGWKIQHQYVVGKRGEDEVHILVSKDAPKMLKPDLNAAKGNTPAKGNSRK